MKWFRHDSSANQDARLKKLRMRYGLQGYGMYWYCLELIAHDVDQTNLTFQLEHDAEILAFDLGIHVDEVNEIMKFMVELGLFENSHGVVTCLKLAKRADEYTAKYLKKSKFDLNKMGMSGECPESVRSKGKEIKQNKNKSSKEISAKEIISDTTWAQ